MGACCSKPGGTLHGGGYDVSSSLDVPTPLSSPASRERHARGTSAIQANSVLSRRAPSAAGTGSSQRQRTATLPPTQRQAQAAAQAAVADVLKFVRDTYYKPNLKSGNKVNGNRGPEEAARQARATLEVERVRSQGDPLTAAMQGKAHQCQELALLAMHHLQERGLQAQVLELGGDDFSVAHDVAITGPASNPLPADMKTWHPDIYVCDPWSNIACRAKDYPAQFTAKMEKWEEAGKLVGYPPKGFVEPTDSDWLHDVLHGQKMV